MVFLRIHRPFLVKEKAWVSTKRRGGRVCKGERERERERESVCVCVRMGMNKGTKYNQNRCIQHQRKKKQESSKKNNEF